MWPPRAGPRWPLRASRLWLSTWRAQQGPPARPHSEADGPGVRQEGRSSLRAGEAEGEVLRTETILRDLPHTWPPSLDWFPIAREFGGWTPKTGNGGIRLEGAEGAVWILEHRFSAWHTVCSFTGTPSGRGIPSLSNSASHHLSF